MHPHTVQLNHNKEKGFEKRKYCPFQFRFNFSFVYSQVFKIRVQKMGKVAHTSYMFCYPVDVISFHSLSILNVTPIVVVELDINIKCKRVLICFGALHVRVILECFELVSRNL